MHNYKNIKTFESSISGVYSFNTPINKEQTDSVIKGGNYEIYEDLNNIIKMSKEILNLDSKEVEELVNNDPTMIKELISIAMNNIKQVNEFIGSRTK